VVATGFVAQLQVDLPLRVKFSELYPKLLFPFCLRVNLQLTESILTPFSVLPIVASVEFVVHLQVDLQLIDKCSRIRAKLLFLFLHTCKCGHN
jgi:hypothetical protein